MIWIFHRARIEGAKHAVDAIAGVTEVYATPIREDAGREITYVWDTENHIIDAALSPTNERSGGFPIVPRRRPVRPARESQPSRICFTSRQSKGSCPAARTSVSANSWTSVFFQACLAWLDWVAGT